MLTARRQAYRESLREEILDAARQLFVKNGYEETSMRGIAAKVGCSPGILYHYFQDKGDIMAHLVRETFHQGDEAVVKSPPVAPGATVTTLSAPAVKAELPSELLKRRPDVREADAKLAAALARLKQSKTDLYPKINLNGLVGRQGTSVSSLAFGGGNFFSLGPQLQLPIFSGGRIKANIAAQQARVEQQRIAYRNELLVAFEEAANALTNLQRQREREGKLAAAAQSARTSLDLSQDLQQAGLNDFLAVLDSQRSLLDAEFQQSLARTQVPVESVALYKALAGGWPQ